MVCGVTSGLGRLAVADLVPRQPALTWPTPADIVYGTPLGPAQLKATADVPGTFVYTPAEGTELNAGAAQVLSVRFTPDDLLHYESTTRTTSISVQPATPTLDWPAPADIVFGTPLDAAQLNATASVPGRFSYTPPLGTILPVGDDQALAVRFAPTDSVNYRAAAASVAISVRPSTAGDYGHGPNGGETLLSGVPSRDPLGVPRRAPSQAFDVAVSIDGVNYTPIPACAGSPARRALRLAIARAGWRRCRIRVSARRSRAAWCRIPATTFSIVDPSSLSRRRTERASGASAARRRSCYAQLRHRCADQPRRES